jgi:hypothetical protein
LDTIPTIDENIEWSCEDCNFKTKELECMMNGPGIETSNDDLCLSNKENLISNLNTHISYKSKDEEKLHEYDEMKAWGKTNRRSMKRILGAQNDFLRNGVMMCKSYEFSKPNGRRRKLILSGEDDDLIDGIAKDSLLGSEEHELAWQNNDGKSMIQILKEHNDYLRDEVTTSQLECSKHNAHRRKLVLPVEHDDLVENDVSFNNDVDVLRKMLSLHRPSKKNEHFGDMRKLALMDEENKSLNFEASSWKETIVCLKNNMLKDFDDKIVLEKNDEMTPKIESDDELIKRSSDSPTKVDPRDAMGSQSEFNNLASMPISWRFAHLTLSFVQSSFSIILKVVSFFWRKVVRFIVMVIILCAFIQL